MARRPYTVVEHPADTGFETTACDLTSLFTNAALALFDLLWQAVPSAEDQEFPLEINGNDTEELMVNFLEEFLYLHDSRCLVMTRIAIDAVAPPTLRGRAWGHPFQAGRDQVRLVAKAVTYHQLHVGNDGAGWRARVMLDI